MATFSVSATGTGLTYQWQVSTNGGMTFTNISGATGATYTVTATSVVSGNKYRVIVSGTAACGSSITSNVALLTVLSGYTTYTQGGWATSPHGGNPGALLQQWFPTLYAHGVVVGGTCTIKLTSQAAVSNYGTGGGSPGVLSHSYANPTSTEAGVFGHQTLTLQFNVDFSTRGITKSGLSSLKVAPGNKLAGYTVSQVLTLANRVLGGTISALPSGCSITDLNNVIDSINNNFDNGSANNGFLVF